MKASSFIKREHEFFTEQLSRFGKAQSRLILLSVIFFVIASGIYIAVQKAFVIMPENYIKLIQKTSYSLLIFLTANLALKFTTPILSRSTRFLDLTTRRLLIKIWNYLIWVIAFLIIIAQFTGNIQSLGVSLGLVSAGLAIALQQPLTCIVAWMIINAKRIYKIGDRIVVRDLKGDVVDITIFHTILREFGRGMEGDDPTGVAVSVPNNIILSEAVYNYTKDFPYIWDEVSTSITYESDINLAMDLIKQAATDVLGDSMIKAVARMRFYLKDTPQEKALSDEPLVFVRMGASSVDLNVKYIVEAHVRRRTRSNISYKILELVNKPENHKKVAIAYPHTELVLRDESITGLMRKHFQK